LLAARLSDCLPDSTSGKLATRLASLQMLAMNDSTAGALRLRRTGTRRRADAVVPPNLAGPVLEQYFVGMDRCVDEPIERIVRPIAPTLA
jgi:hypothetical protein